MTERHAGPNAATAVGGCGAFSVTTERRDTVLLVTVEGRIDSRTVGRLENAVWAGLREDTRSIVVDLEKVRAVLSAGLKFLLTLRKFASGRGGSLALVVPEGTVRDILAISQFDDIVPIFEDPAEAVSAMERETR